MFTLQCFTHDESCQYPHNLPLIYSPREPSGCLPALPGSHGADPLCPPNLIYASAYSLIVQTPLTGLGIPARLLTTKSTASINLTFANTRSKHLIYIEKYHDENHTYTQTPAS
ncbi:uncharacterized protein Asalp_03470 [Aeromonas salmonicida subsp. pectinolytica 34mel]|uniref:Uncharacterized protein n=1 Tax=Aeromonas salmonicida subsp. pectinolytica 34mel TaxID=1324960 RepID=A0A2D1QB13_AERSA|nr:uncharacterized protein Asalp_03470 [Aeromonas salmonicida subsp. pectinolytica 34mel]